MLLLQFLCLIVVFSVTLTVPFFFQPTATSSPPFSFCYLCYFFIPLTLYVFLGHVDRFYFKERKRIWYCIVCIFAHIFLGRLILQSTTYPVNFSWYSSFFSRCFLNDSLKFLDLSQNSLNMSSKLATTAAQPCLKNDSWNYIDISGRGR